MENASTTRLTPPQTQSLLEQGYAHLPQLIPAEAWQGAAKAVAISLGRDGMDPVLLPKFRTQSFCPEVQGTPPITGLYNETPLGAVVESLLGAGQVRPVGGGQIALRFPSNGPPGVPHPHIDGTYHPLNGVPEGQLDSFTALVAVFLSDVPVENAGNFTVWPGSHLLCEQYFRENGGQILVQGVTDVGFVALPAPRQIIARAGDALIAHHLLAHSVASNVWWQTRQAVFFRVKHVRHDEEKWDVLSDVWRHWPGMITG